MPRASRSRNAASRISIYSCQCERNSESDLPLRSVTWSEGLKMVQNGKAQWEHNRVGQIKGLRFIERQRAQNPSPCTLDVRVLKSVSGEGLAGPHSINDRALTGQEERQRLKFVVWPLIGDTRATCVRPRISAEHRKAAEKLLGITATT